LAGAKLILVMGHQDCGAVKGAIDDVRLGNVTTMLAKIKPAVEMSRDFGGEKISKNREFVRHICENNVRHALKQIREKSPILKEMEDKGEIKIVGAFYRLTDGTFEILQ
jgi:carbonic anhydrase